MSHLVFEKDVDGYAKERDEEIMKLAKEAGVEVLSIPGRTLWDSDELVKANGGKPTMSATQVRRVCAFQYFFTSVPTRSMCQKSMLAQIVLFAVSRMFD